MKEINYKKYLMYFLIVLIIFMAFNEVVLADTGFDVDFGIDSGGNSLLLILIIYVVFSFASVFSFNANVFQLFTVITTTTLVIYLFLELFNFKGTETVNSNKHKRKYPIIYEDDILKVYPKFNKKEFLRMANTYYIELQTAWMNFDYNKIKSLTTDELYKTYKSGLDSLKEKNQKNIVSNIKIYWISFSKIEINDNKVSITIAYDLAQRDYIVNNRNLIIRGTKKRQDIISLVTFVKSESKNKLTKCPSCGAPINKNNQSNKCKYCNSTIINNDYDWVISKKEVVKQKIIKE